MECKACFLGGKMNKPEPAGFSGKWNNEQLSKVNKNINIILKLIDISKSLNAAHLLEDHLLSPQLHYNYCQHYLYSNTQIK